jgi:hypothetical protein
MPRPPRLDVALLLLLAASLLFGGGLGCEPALEGTTLRATSFEDVRYAAFTGRRAPGNGWAVLEYPARPFDPPEAGEETVEAKIEASVGVLNPRHLEASAGAAGCVALREKTPGGDLRICASYEIAPPNLRIFSTLSAAEADCPAATEALLRVADDDTNLTVSYQCPAAANATTLASVPSPIDEGEKWFLAFGVEGLAKGGEIGFHTLRITSHGPFLEVVQGQPQRQTTPEGLIAFATFNALRIGIETFHRFGDPDQFNGGIGGANQSWVQLNGAANSTANQNRFPDTDVLRNLTRARSMLVKLDNRLFPGKVDGYFKAFPKIAALLAAALAEEEESLE